MTLKNIGASVRAPIHNEATSDQVNTQLLLMRCAFERLLYRLAVSVLRCKLQAFSLDGKFTYL